MADKPAGGEANRAREKQLDERKARLAAALRANLRRRKQQARGRTQPPDEAEAGARAGQQPQNRED